MSYQGEPISTIIEIIPAPFLKISSKKVFFCTQKQENGSKNSEAIHTNSLTNSKTFCSYKFAVKKTQKKFFSQK